MNDIPTFIVVVFWIVIYFFLKYGVPIVLVFVGYFIFKRYRNNTQTNTNNKPNSPVKQGILKP